MDDCLQILKKSNDLESLLASVKNKHVTIATAFSSNVENLIKKILKNKNKLNLTVGTINSFTSPTLIQTCKRTKNKKFSFYVDFGYQNSIHWKLYLVSPDIVIVGSANFTKIGIGMSRDTCVQIQSKSLYKSYISMIKGLQQTSSVISSKKEKSFEKQLKKYIESHKKMQDSLNRTNTYSSINKWLTNDVNQEILVFFWESFHSKDTKLDAYELIEGDDENVSKDNVRDFFTYVCDEGDLPYNQGDVVLCAKNDGSYLGFYSFDRIIYYQGLYYIYSYKNKSRKYSRPFSIRKEEKNEIIKKIPKWNKKELTSIHRDTLESIVKNC